VRYSDDKKNEESCAVLVAGGVRCGVELLSPSDHCSRPFTCALSPAAGGNVSEGVYPGFDYEPKQRSAVGKRVFVGKFIQ
jgi:hypothetical protein